MIITLTIVTVFIYKSVQAINTAANSVQAIKVINTHNNNQY
jgi:hypothetical protein